MDFSDPMVMTIAVPVALRPAMAVRFSSRTIANSALRLSTSARSVISCWANWSAWSAAWAPSGNSAQDNRVAAARGSRNRRGDMGKDPAGDRRGASLGTADDSFLTLWSHPWRVWIASINVLNRLAIRAGICLSGEK